MEMTELNISNFVLWSQRLDAATDGKKLSELLRDLRNLPESAVRTAREATVLHRLEQADAARALLATHPTNPLCRALLATMDAASGDPDLLRKVLEDCKPEDVPVWDLLDLEARRLMQWARVLSAVSLCFEQQAQLELDLYAHHVTVFGDASLKCNLLLEKARLHMNFGHWTEAGTLYSTLLQPETPCKAYARDTAAENALWVEFLGGVTSGPLPEWAKRTLQALQNQIPAEVTKDLGRSGPMHAALAIQQTAQLLAWWNLNLPVVHGVEATEALHQQKIQQVCQIPDQFDDPISVLFVRLCHGLALSTTGKAEALSVTLGSLDCPVSHTPLLAALHAACVIQVHHNVPSAPESLARPYAGFVEALTAIYGTLNDHERGVVGWWAQTFCPAALLVLDEAFVDYALRSAARKVVVVDASAHFMHQKQRIVGYPVALLNRCILDVLAAKPLQGTDLQQAYRHPRALQNATGSRMPHVVFEVVRKALRGKFSGARGVA